MGLKWKSLYVFVLTATVLGMLIVSVLDNRVRESSPTDTHGSTYLMTVPPDDHLSLIQNLSFTPPMPEAKTKKVCVYVGEERFKSNPSPTTHSGWLIIEEYEEGGVYQAMAFVDLWTITPENVTPRIYTLEIVKLEKVPILSLIHI